MHKDISSAVINRLPRYYRYLGELLEHDVIRISSRELSERMHVTASQIRQDLNNFGGFGQQGYGYNVAVLYKEIGKILGLDKKYHMIIIGAGNLGQALANYSDFERRGFVVKAMFDSSAGKVGKYIRGIEIHSMEELNDYVKKNRVDIAAIAIPEEKAPQIAAELADNGVKAFWNFAHTDLHLPDNIPVQNVHLVEGLMQLSYKLSSYDGKEE